MTARPDTATATAREPRSLDDLLGEVDRLRSEVESLRAERAPGAGVASAGSRRDLFRLAGASAVGLVAGGIAGGGQPVAAADPNDVVKNTTNAIDDTTVLDGPTDGPVFTAFNRSTDSDAVGVFAQTVATDSIAVRADAEGSDGIGVGANAPNGRDVFAFGSGRIAMVDHDFDSATGYAPGEIHQSDGTLYATVTASERRALAGPGTAGALHPLTPTRVYDSRQPLPSPGRMQPSEFRPISVADGRSTVDGSISVPGLVPSGATAILYNVTVTQTLGAGFLEVAPSGTPGVNSSTVNWSGDSQTVANSSFVGLGGDREIRVFCSLTGTADVIIDVLGYYA